MLFIGKVLLIASAHAAVIAFMIPLVCIVHFTIGIAMHLSDVLVDGVLDLGSKLFKIITKPNQ
jgi:hypothetical protein